MRHERTAGRRAEAGFTLLEMLVAFTILALTLGVAMRLLSSGFGSIEAADRYVTAVSLARSTMAELGVAQPLRLGETSGYFADGYRWRVAVDRHPLSPTGTLRPNASPIPFPVDKLPVPLGVTITVSWNAGTQERAVTLATVRLGLNR